MIDRLEALHKLGYIHRDLKPENICTDLKKNSDKIYLIDFGLSKKYIEDDGKHILIREKRVGYLTFRHVSNYFIGLSRHHSVHFMQFTPFNRVES
jgi:casein kinase 1